MQTNLLQIGRHLSHDTALPPPDPKLLPWCTALLCRFNTAGAVELWSMCVCVRDCLGLWASAPSVRGLMRWRCQEEHSPPLSLSLSLPVFLSLLLSLSSLRAARVIIVTLSQHHSHMPAHVVRRILVWRLRVTVNRRHDAGSSKYHYEMMMASQRLKKIVLTKIKTA